MEPTRRIRVPARRLSWLHAELGRWEAEGIVDATAAQRIRDRYAVGRRLSLERLVLVLGGGFLGVGLIWLVSANLDELSPLVRFAGITLAWIAAVVVAEVLAHRGGRQAARLVAVLAGGGVVFQAAQSLQVPAYTSSLLGVWAAGALAYAYATGAAGPLVAALLLAPSWYCWLAVDQAESASAIAVSLLVAGAVATSAAVLHERDRRQDDRPPGTSGGPGERARMSGFAAPWRLAGVVLVLAGLFVAAFPGVGQERLYGSAAVWAGLGVAAVITVAAFVIGGKGGRHEVLAVTVMIGLALLLMAWSPGDAAGFDGTFTAALTARAVAGTLVYILAATWFAAVAARRDLSYLVFIATAALVAFVTAQSFTLFQPIFSGAALFLVLGVVFIATGALVFYGRRRLMEVTS